MRKTIKSLALAFGCVCGLSLSAMAQETQFSQFYASSVYLNPALAGLETSFTLNTNFRSQWRSVNSPFITNQISAIMPVAPNAKTGAQLGAFGLSLFNDQAGAGALRTVGVLGTAAVSIGSDMSRFTLGLQGGFKQRTIDFNELRFGGQFNNLTGGTGSTPAEVAGFNNRKLFPEFNAGVMYSYNPSRNSYQSGTSFFLGAAASNINQPNASFFSDGKDKVPVLIKAHGGFEQAITESFRIAPNVLYAMQADARQLNVGSYFMFNVVDSPVGPFAYTDLVLGGFYRLGDAAIASIGLQNPTFTLGFSYDFNTSQLRQYSNGRGAYEFSFAFRNVRDKVRRRFDTPRI